MVEFVFRPPKESDVPMARQMLSSAGLPVEDVTIDRLALLAEQDGKVAGLIGLEQLGEVGLLRSLVVLPEHRGGGVGGALVAALENMATDRDISELWLLTIDADAWFAQLGFSRVARDAAPLTIQNTEEFSSLCPGDAVLMRKALLD